MSWLLKKIRAVQQKPYRERIRILWSIVAGVTIILLVVWFLTIRYRHLGANDTGPSKFQPIFENLKKIKP